MRQRNQFAVSEVACMIKMLKFASLPVSNQERSLAFFTEKLGFKVMTDQEFDENQRWIELGIGNSQTAIVLFTPDEHAARIGTFSGLSFKCDDVEKTYDELIERGVEFVQPPKRESWGTSALFKDPDGNLFVMSD
jgi:catechol 2,3-dioxygenase-like lactoylglutathione lyase family enzyme